MPVEVHQRDGRLRFRVRVAPGARKAGIVGPHGGALKVRVQAPPERGKANREVCALLADHLGVAPADVTVVAGHASRDKTIEVTGPGVAAARRVLESA